MIKKFHIKKFGTVYNFFFFKLNINMTNPQQNKVQNEIKQCKKHINILRDKLKQLKYGEKRIAKMKNKSELTGKKNSK